MEKGRLIAQGSPAQLLKAHFDDTIITIPEADFSAAMDSYPEEAYLYHGHVNIRTVDVEQSIQTLLDHKIPLAHLEIRARTLDDLFVELTQNDAEETA